MSPRGNPSWYIDAYENSHCNTTKYVSKLKDVYINCNIIFIPDRCASRIIPMQTYNNLRTQVMQSYSKWYRTHWVNAWRSPEDFIKMSKQK